MPTDRPNLQYNVVKAFGIDKFVHIMKDFLVSFRSDNSIRAIVYFPSYAKLENVYNICSRSFDIKKHYGKNSLSENMISVESWMRGDVSIMFATSGFSVGIDYPYVRLVVCYSEPFDIESMVQQFGRAGRDGVKSNAVLYVNQNYPLTERTDLLIKQFIENDEVCRRYFISQYMDLFPIDCFERDRKAIEFNRKKIFTSIRQLLQFTSSFGHAKDLK